MSDAATQTLRRQLAQAPTQPLVEQLAVGGRMVIPVGGEHRTQDLLLIRKTAGGAVKRSLFPVRFVPMTGRARAR